MTTCYLEVDDEITGAIARLRAVKDGEAIIVVPPGSRIATSRINFKLLVREANERRLNVAAVSDEPSVRALAMSAELPAYDSLIAAEQALANFREQDRKLAERLGVPVDELARPRTRVPTPTAPPPASPEKPTAPAAATAPNARPTERTEVFLASTADRTPGPPREPAAGTEVLLKRRRVGILPLAVAGLMVLLLTGVGYGAYVFLPTATITLQPLATELRPPPFTVVADPDVAVPDAAAAVVPAQLLEIPLSVSGMFAATGLEARETRASGVVTFRSENTLNAVPILEGTIVSTVDGIEFQTTDPTSVPRADFATSTPGMVDVPVRAVRPGPRGNVPAEAITEVPASLSGQLVSVRNPDPTAGGRRVEENVVAQHDYDMALASLVSQLDTRLQTELADPATTPRGLTLFPSSASVGEPQPDRTALEVVGSPGTTFALTVESTATVLAVNESQVDELAKARLRASLAAGQRLVDEVQATHSAGVLVADAVTYEASASATVFTEPERQLLVAQLRGKSVTEARRILDAYGMVEVSMWPEFVDRLPDQTARINLIVVAPSARP